MRSPTPTPRDLRPEALVRHLDRLHRAARSLCGGSRHEAEDLVQDTCVQLLGTRRVIRGADELPYLLSALRNTHADRRRAAARRPAAVGLDAAAEPADPHVPVDEAVSAREVLRWVSALPAEPRAAVMTVDLAGLSRADAARVLGVGERRVAAALARGRAGLAARITDEKIRGDQGRRPGRAPGASARP